MVEQHRAWPTGTGFRPCNRRAAEGEDVKRRLGVKVLVPGAFSGPGDLGGVGGTGARAEDQPL